MPGPSSRDQQPAEALPVQAPQGCLCSTPALSCAARPPLRSPGSRSCFHYPLACCPRGVVGCKESPSSGFRPAAARERGDRAALPALPLPWHGLFQRGVQRRGPGQGLQPGLALPLSLHVATDVAPYVWALAGAQQASPKPSHLLREPGLVPSQLLVPSSLHSGLYFAQCRSLVCQLCLSSGLVAWLLFDV